MAFGLNAWAKKTCFLTSFKLNTGATHAYFARKRYRKKMKRETTQIQRGRIQIPVSVDSYVEFVPDILLVAR